MVEPEVSLVLLCAFLLYHVARLSDADGLTFTRDLVDTRSFQTKAVFDRPENTMSVRNSSDFMQAISSLVVGPEDIIVSFGVVSLFTHVPLRKHWICWTNRLADIMSLFHLALTSAYFLFNGCFYEQKNEVAIVSPLSPDIANYYVKHFEA
jgi:hypothetical protein